MTFPIPPSQSRPGARRRPAVNYGDLGYGPEDLPVPPAAVPPVPVPPVPVAPVPVAPVAPEPLAARVVPEPAVVFPAAASLADPALISSHPVAVTPAVSEEEQWWADEGTDLPDDTDLPEDDTAAASAVTAPVKKPRRRTAASRVSSAPTGSTAAGRGQGSGIRLVRRVLGLNRPTGAAPARAAGAGGSSDGSAPGWLSDLETGEVLAAGDPTAGGQDAAAAGDGPARPPRRVPRPSQDLEVSRAPRELGATVRLALIGLVLLLIAFAGVKQVIWNPIFGRTPGTAAAGPAGMDQVAADGAATKYALDYLSYSPAGAGAAAAAVTADVVGGGDAAPRRWTGSGYLHADTAVPGSWHVIDAAHAVVSVTVRVHLAMPPATQATTTTTTPTTPAAAAPTSPSTAAAPPTPTKPTPTSIPTAAKPGTAAKRPRPGRTTAAPKPPAAAPVAPAAAYMSAAPATIPAPTPTPETTAEVGTAAVPSGSASDPGAVPAGWTDLGSRWLTLAVPVQSSAGVVKVSPSGAVLSGEAPNLVTSDPAWLADPATTTATASVVTSFFPAYAQSNAGYLAEPGVDLAGLAGTVTVASVTGWNVLVPPAPVSGSASPASSGVGAAAVTWQLAGTDLQIQQSYSIALSNSQSRWYISTLSPVLSTTAQ